MYGALHGTGICIPNHECSCSKNYEIPVLQESSDMFSLAIFLSAGLKVVGKIFDVMAWVASGYISVANVLRDSYIKGVSRRSG
jgi:hypothetical protein